MPPKVKIKALQSRSASQSPTGKALKPDDEYLIDASEADGEVRRGLAARLDVADKATASKG